VGEPEPPDFVRAGGDVRCTGCRKPYKEHPLAEEHIGFDGYPYLHRLCDGTLVKL